MVRQNKYIVNLFERLLVICRPKSFMLNSIPFWLSVIQFSRSPCHNSTVKYIIKTQVFPAAQKKKWRVLLQFSDLHVLDIVVCKAICTRCVMDS